MKNERLVSGFMDDCPDPCACRRRGLDGLFNRGLFWPIVSVVTHPYLVWDGGWGLNRLKPMNKPKRYEDHPVNATYYENGDIKFQCSVCPKTWISYYVRGRRLLVVTREGSISARHIGSGAGFPLKGGLQIDFDTNEVKG